MTFEQVIQAAIPNASPELCDFVLWERTPYPMGKVTARSLYRAASRLRRAQEHGILLCEMCDWPGKERGFVIICERCAEALDFKPAE